MGKLWFLLKNPRTDELVNLSCMDVIALQILVEAEKIPLLLVGKSLRKKFLKSDVRKPILTFVLSGS